MYKIDWNKYLCDKRYRSNSEFQKNLDSSNEIDKRNNFESDFGRVAFSSAVRRMHDKTQVMPLTTGDSVHTRLTHSIEVMSIAYSMGIALCRDKDFINLYGEKDAMELERQIPIILKTAAFIHDIGNPPFGHFGENIIQNFFKGYLKKRSITDDQALDFTHFDGNAEGFRIITRLQHIGDLSGLNLTYATLAAYCKYPNLGAPNKNYVGYKKHGIFTSEKNVFDEMIKECHLIKDDGKIKRHPLSFLVEAADSISYYVMDIEDGFSMGWYKFDDIVHFIDESANNTKKGDPILHKLKLDNNYVPDKKDERRKMCDFRVRSIRYLVEKAMNKFKNNLQKIDEGSFNNELLDDNPFASALKEFSKLYIFPQRQIEQIELTGCSVIRGLLDILTKYAFCDDSNYRNRLKSIISKSALRVAIRESESILDDSSYNFKTNEELLSFDIENLNEYSRLRMIVDLISGMTDRYAVSMYQKLSGQRL